MSSYKPDPERWEIMAQQMRDEAQRLRQEVETIEEGQINWRLDRIARAENAARELDDLGVMLRKAAPVSLDVQTMGYTPEQAQKVAETLAHTTQEGVQPDTVQPDTANDHDFEPDDGLGP